MNVLIDVDRGPLGSKENPPGRTGKVWNGMQAETVAENDKKHRQLRVASEFYMEPSKAYNSVPGRWRKRDRTAQKDATCIDDLKTIKRQSRL